MPRNKHQSAAGARQVPDSAGKSLPDLAYGAVLTFKTYCRGCSLKERPHNIVDASLFRGYKKSTSVLGHSLSR